jgi:hypothetical protein
MALGIAARSLGTASSKRGAGPNGTLGVPFVAFCQTVTGTTAYTLISAAEKKFRVINAWLIMTAAGGASDTVVLSNGSTAITDTADVSLLADKDLMDFTSFNDASYAVAAGGSLKVTTASDALCQVYALCMWVE